jgi:SAM-dependent methyltransferase
MSQTKYGRYWDAFYAKTYVQGARKALWDVPAEWSVGKDLEIFQGHFQPSLPVLDIGCGTGVQAHYLAGVYAQVIGIDAAPTAIELARGHHLRPGLEFLAADAADAADCARLHERWGDMNLYMRGVLHQVEADSQAQFVDNLARLMGKQGRLYFIEVADHIRAYFAEASSGFHELPTAVQEVFVSNLPPHGLNLDMLPRLFPSERFEIIQCGPGGLRTNLVLPSGRAIEIPAVFGLVGPAQQIIDR